MARAPAHTPSRTTRDGRASLGIAAVKTPTVAIAGLSSVETSAFAICSRIFVYSQRTSHKVGE